jgi:glycosyltransferase involved in cell wall biosynthesis
MARGLACVGSVHDAAGEVIVDGETGRLVDQSDLRHLAETITALLLDDAGRRRMGVAGDCRVRSEFTFQHFKSRVCHLLKRPQPSLATVGA